MSTFSNTAQTCVTAIPNVLVHTRLSAHASRPPHLQTQISRSHDCKNMFQSLSDVDLCTEQLDRSIRNLVLFQSTQVTVRLFESDTRVIERARLKVHSARVSGNSTRLHADVTTVVILSVTVNLVSMFLLKCPGKSDFQK